MPYVGRIFKSSPLNPLKGAQEVMKIPEATCDESKLPAPINKMCSKEGSVAEGMPKKEMLDGTITPIEKGCEYYLWRYEKAAFDGPQNHGKLAMKAFHDLTDLLENEYKYCKMFNQEYYPKMSEKGKKWHDFRRCNLQTRVEDYFQKQKEKWIPARPANATVEAFDEMHGWANSEKLSSLPLSDWDILTPTGLGGAHKWGRTTHNLSGAWLGDIGKEVVKEAKESTFGDWLDLLGRGAESLVW